MASINVTRSASDGRPHSRFALTLGSSCFSLLLAFALSLQLNVHEDMHSHPDPTLRDSATSVQQALADWRASSSSSSAAATTSAAPLVPVTRESVLASFLLSFESLIGRSASAVQAEYARYDLLLGRTVVVMPKKREDTTAYYTARAIEFSPEGFLVVETEAGERQVLVAEEVTIRPQG